jgi:hypothetical protein
MGTLIPVYLADMFGVKAIAFLAVVLVVYLFWTGIKEKRAQRRERQWLENKRRQVKKQAARETEPPAKP